MRRFPRYPRKPHSSGQARIKIDQEDVYLGVFNSQESRAKYDQLKKKWERNPSGFVSPRSAVRTVGDLIARFLLHARDHYRHADGTQTQEYATYQQTVKPLDRLYGNLPVEKFGKKELKAVRQAMIDGSWLTEDEKAKRRENKFPDGLSRKTANHRIRKIKHIFWWGADEELIPDEIYARLTTVRGLEEGRTTAPDYEPVEPVPEEIVQKTLPHLGPVVGAMVQVQLFTSMRPGEVCTLKPEQIDIEGIEVGGTRIWIYRPPLHKTRHKGKVRAVPIGPKAQEVLKPFLNRPPATYCFSAMESKKAHHQERAARSKKSRAKGRYVGRDHFTGDSYYRRIRRACEKAKVPLWHPNQLRHTMASRINAEFGIDAARAVLGHSTPVTSAVYAARDLKQAATIAAKLG